MKRVKGCFDSVDILYSKTCLKQPLKRTPKIVFQYRLSLNEGQSVAECYEHSAIGLTFIKLPLSIKTLVFVYF